jgi:hypothetical protein
LSPCGFKPHSVCRFLCFRFPKLLCFNRKHQVSKKRREKARTEEQW